MHLEKYLYKKDVTPEDVTNEAPTDEEWVQVYRGLGIVTTPVGWDAETAMAPGDPIYESNSNDYIDSLRDRFPDVVITGWGSVDPWKGWKAQEEAIRYIKELKLVRFKFQQVGQAFSVADKRFYALWDMCQEMGIPIQLHRGFTELGSGSHQDCRLYGIGDKQDEFPCQTGYSQQNAENSEGHLEGDQRLHTLHFCIKCYAVGY